MRSNELKYRRRSNKETNLDNNKPTTCAPRFFLCKPLGYIRYRAYQAVNNLQYANIVRYIIIYSFVVIYDIRIEYTRVRVIHMNNICRHLKRIKLEGKLFYGQYINDRDI